MFCSYCHHYNPCPQCNLWFCEACGLEMEPVGTELLVGINRQAYQVVQIEKKSNN